MSVEVKDVNEVKAILNTLTDQELFEVIGSAEDLLRSHDWYFSDEYNQWFKRSGK